MSNRNYSLDTGKKQGNVRVTREPDKKTGYAILKVFLHGHKVFEANYAKRYITFSMCGWYTSSSRDVINTALREFRPDMHIFKSKNIWRVSFANGAEESHLEPCEDKKYEF